MTELQELKQFIKKRFPIGCTIYDSTRSQPYVINKRTVYWVKPWTPEDYNDEMRPDDDRDYTVDFMVHDPGKNTPVYSLCSYPKKWCLEKYSK